VNCVGTTGVANVIVAINKNKNIANEKQSFASGLQVAIFAVINYPISLSDTYSQTKIILNQVFILKIQNCSYD
jgi:hypothetical protein